MEAYGYPYPVEVTGWTYCEIREHRQGNWKHPRVLFAPIHREQNGYIRPSAAAANQEIHRILVEFAERGEIDLTVRHIGPLGDNKHPAARYIMGEPDGSYTEIDQADVVIGNQTFAYLAVARGRGTIMYLDKELPCSGDGPHRMLYAKSWDSYRDIMKYPFYYEDQPGNLLNMIKSVCFKNHSVEVSKSRFIGQQFDPKQFVERLAGCL